jgi:GntR family transcriptional regulator
MTPTFNPEPVGYLYEQMAAHLEARIRAGELRPNRPLPAEQQLAREYGVSLGTARHAVRLLRFRGLVQVIRSKGTYVSPIDALPEARQGEATSDAEPVGRGSVEGCQWL